MVTLGEIAEKVFAKIGFVRVKSFDTLWAMARENTLFQDTVNREYERVPTVYKAIKAISDNAPQAKLRFYRKSDDEKYLDADLQKLFDNPNPLMSFSELIEATIIYHRLHGEAFWIFEKSFGQITGARKVPAEIWTFSPTKFKENISKETGELLGWRYNKEIYANEDVMQIKDFSPYDEIRGLSPLKPARQTIDIDWQQMVYNKAFFKNDATPSFALSTDQPLNKTQRQQILEWWNKENRGASNAFKAAVFESGLKPVSIAHSATDMQFIDQKKLNREEMIGIWRVPKSMFSITDDLNYATFIGQKKLFWTDTIMPILNRIAEELNAKFFNRYLPDVYCKFDYSNVLALQEDLKERLTSVKMLFDMGVPFNILSEKFNLGIENIPGGDVGYLPFNLTPISTIGQPSEVPPVAPAEETAPKAITMQQTELIWKGFLRRHESVERKLQKVVSDHLYQQRSRILSTLNEKSVEKVIQFSYDWEKEASILAKKAEPSFLQAIMQGVEFARGVAGGNVEEAVLSGRLRSYLAVQVNQLKRVTESQRVRVEKIITDGIRNGDSVGTIANNLREFYNGFSPMASLRIARTETTRGINGGTLEYFDAVGAKTKTWLTAGDEHVRETHVHQHGDTILLDQRFANGLLYPGDEGDPSEVVNCRCTLITRERFA